MAPTSPSAPPPSNDLPHVVIKGFNVNRTAPGAHPSASGSGLTDDWSRISVGESSTGGDDLISLPSLGSSTVDLGGVATGSEGPYPMTQRNLAVQTQNTALTDEHKALKAENDMLKAILQIRTLERGLGEQGTVLSLATQVHRLIEEVSTKETVLKLFARAENPTPTELPCIDTTQDAQVHKAESVSEDQRSLRARVRLAEQRLVALRLYAAAQAAYPETKHAHLVAKIMDNPDRFPLPDVASVNWRVLPPLLQAISDHHIGWLVPFVVDPNSNLLSQAVHFACATYGDKKAGLEAFIKAKGDLSPNECRQVMESRTVQNHLDFALEAAQAVVRGCNKEPTLTAPWQADTLYKLVKEADLLPPMWADLPFYVSPRDVRALLLHPGFIDHVISSGVATAEPTAESKGDPPPEALARGPETAADKAAALESISIISSVDPSVAAPQEAAIVSPNFFGCAEVAGGAQRGKVKAVEADGPSNGAPISSVSGSGAESSRRDTEDSVDGIPLVRSYPLSKNQLRKAKKREEVERRKANKASMRAEKEKAATAATGQDSQTNTSDPNTFNASKTGSSRAITWNYNHSAKPEEIEEAREVYARTNVNANIILESLMKRHKMMAEDMLAELQLQQRGFYRLTRGEMDILTQYPETVTIEGETYAMSVPLGERDRIGGALGQRLGVPGASLDASQGPSETSGASGRAEWEEGSEASTEIGIEYPEDDGEDDFDSDELEDN